MSGSDIMQSIGEAKSVYNMMIGIIISIILFIIGIFLVMYKEEVPKDNIENKNTISSKMYGAICFVISILIIVFVIINYNLVKSNKNYATLQGMNTSFDVANTAVNFGKNLFK